MHSSPVSVIMRYQVTVHTSLSREVFGMNVPKSRDIQAKIPLPQAIWNEFGYVTVNGNVELRELRSNGAIRRYRRK